MMKLNRIFPLFILMLLILPLVSAIVVNPPAVVRDFTSPGTYYHSSGNLAYFAVDHVMTFTQVVVDSTYVQFNNTKFNISSPNRINISLDYLGATMNGSSGTTIISFYAQTTTGTAKFNISGLTSGRSYTVYKNNVSYNTSTANATGWLYFRNNAWTTVYFEIVLLGVLPVVTTNASTGVEETNATLNGYLTNDGGGIIKNLVLSVTGDGSHIGLSHTGGVDSWDCINADNNGGMIWRTVLTYEYDSFVVQDHTTESGGIINVTIVTKGRAVGLNTAVGKHTVYIGGSPYYGAEFTLPIAGLWANRVTRNTSFTTNPATTSSWTWADIDSTQYGIASKGSVATDSVTDFLEVKVYYYNGTGSYFQYGTTTAYGTTTTLQGKLTGQTFNQNIAGLTPGQLYHFRSIATNSNGTSYGSDRTFVTKPNAPDTASFTIVSNTRSLGLNWTKGTGTNNTLIVRKQGAYPLTKTDGTIVYNGTGSSYTNTGLTPGVGYGYRAWSYTSWGTTWQFSDANATACEITKPEGPYHGNLTILTAYGNGTMKVRMNWTKGQGANNTILLRTADHPPVSWTDGTIIYNGTGTSTDIFIPYSSGSPEYYNVWSYAGWIINPHLWEISANSTNISFGGFGGLLINCFDESTGTNLTFNVTIVSHDGSETYVVHSATNTLVINATLCPQGDDVVIMISAEWHNPRTYYIDIYSGIVYLLNAYLPPTTTPPPPGNDSYLYQLSIVNPYSVPIDNVHVIIKGLINETTYKIITNGYTDGNGQISAWLIPGKLYKVLLSKWPSFDNVTADYIPSTVVFTQTFKMYFSTNITPTYSFHDTIIFNATMNNDSTIFVRYKDKNSTTIDTKIYCYELFNSIYTQIDLDSRVGSNSFTYSIAGINTSRTYLLSLYFNNSRTLDVSSPYSITIYPINTSAGINVTQIDIDQIITDIIGPPPNGLGNWPTILSAMVAIILLVSFGVYNTGFGIIAAGFGLGITQTLFAVYFVGTVALGLVILCPVCIVIGIVYIMAKGEASDRL